MRAMFIGTTGNTLDVVIYFRIVTKSESVEDERYFLTVITESC